MFTKFAEVVGLPEWKGEKFTEDLAISMVIQKLRAVLGIEGLTSLRKVLITKAVVQLKYMG